MSLFLLAKKFPRYFIAAAIFLSSGVVFFLWLMMGEGYSSDGYVDDGGGKLAASNVNEVILCGNTLVHLPTGKILAEQWIEGIGDSAPNIAGVLPKKDLVILTGNGRIFFYSMNGKPKPPISVDGSPIGRAAFDRDNFRVVYVKDGDIWMGLLDPGSFVVTSPKQVTKVGYFRDDSVFTPGWHWVGDNLFLSISGKTHLVALNTGEIRQESVPLASIIQGASADGKTSAAYAGHGRFGILDLENITATQFPLTGGAKQIVWLDESRVAVNGGHAHLQVYDREKKEIVATLQNGQQIKAVVAKSPSGNLLLASLTRGAHLIDTESGSFTLVALPMEAATFVSNDKLLCSNASSETAVRGVWTVDASGKTERIFDYPADTARNGGASIVPSNDGAAFVSGGNLWLYDGNAPRQIIQAGGIAPPLQILNTPSYP